MNQSIIITKICGKTSEAILDKLKAGNDLLNLKERIESIKEEAPVLFYCDFQDKWSMADSILDITKNNDSEFYSIDGIEFYCFSASTLKLKRKLSQFAEDDFISKTLKHSQKCWSQLNDQSIIFIIRTVSGASIFDHEVEQSLTQSKL